MEKKLGRLVCAVPVFFFHLFDYKEPHSAQGLRAINYYNVNGVGTYMRKKIALEYFYILPI